MVRRLDLPNQDGPEDTTRARVVKPLNIQEQIQLSVAPRVKTLQIEETAVPVSTRAQKPKSKTDCVLDDISKFDATVPAYLYRATIDKLLSNDVNTFLDYGRGGLEAIKKLSDINSEITTSLSRLNVSQWLTDTMENSCRSPKLIDYFVSVKSPDYYETMLNKIYRDLEVLLKRCLDAQAGSAKDVKNLKAESIISSTLIKYIDDQNMLLVANNKAKSLINACNTLAMIETSLQNSIVTITGYISKIDDLMTNTIPNWKLAYKESFK